MAKYEGESTPKSALLGRREDPGIAPLQSTLPPSQHGSYSFDQPGYASMPMQQPGPSSSGLEGRPGASRMEPAYIPPSGVLATGPPAVGYASQGFAPQGYTPQPVHMEAINTHETNTTLDNFPVTGLQPVPYTGADPPTPPQALSQLDLNQTVWTTQPATAPYGTTSQFSFDAQQRFEPGPPQTITTVVPGTGVQFSEPGRPQFASEPARTQFAPSSSDFAQQQVSFQSLQPQGRDAPNYPAFAPQREGRTDGYSTGILKPPGTYSPQFAPQSSNLSPPRTISSPRAAFRDTASAQGLRSSGGLQDVRGVNSGQTLGSISMPPPARPGTSSLPAERLGSSSVPMPGPARDFTSLPPPSTLNTVPADRPGERPYSGPVKKLDSDGKEIGVVGSTSATRNEDVFPSSTVMSSARLGPRPAAMRSEGLPGTRTLTADDIFGQGRSGTRTINADDVGYASRREFAPRPMSRGGSLQAMPMTSSGFQGMPMPTSGYAAPPSPPTQFRMPIEPMILSEQDLGPSLQPVQEMSPMPTSLKSNRDKEPQKLSGSKEQNILGNLGKDDIHEKENLISEIRERDATIARLLSEVRSKRANRLREVENLADRMDHLEARLLSGHIDPH